MGASIKEREKLNDQEQEIRETNLVAATAVLEGAREVAEDITEAIVGEKQRRGELGPHPRRQNLFWRLRRGVLGGSGSGRGESWTTLERRRRRSRSEGSIKVGIGIGDRSGGGTVAGPVARSAAFVATRRSGLLLLHFLLRKSI